jgi:hypothetical protein
MPWRPTLTRLAAAMTGHAYLAIVDHGYRDLPWQAEGLLEIAGRAVTAPTRFRQTVAGYVEHFHSTSSLARELMPGEEAAAFDRAVAGLVRPYATDGLLDLPVVAGLAWERITVTAAR